MSHTAAGQPSVADRATGAVHVRTVPIDDADAAAVIDQGTWCWLSRDVELAGWGVAARWSPPVVAPADRPGGLSNPAGGPSDTSGATGRFDDVARRLTPWFAGLQHDRADPTAPAPVAFASFTFDPGAEGSVVVVPATTVTRRGGRAWLTAVRPHPVSDDDLRLPQARTVAAPPRVRYAGRTATEIAWIDAVDRAVDRIRAGDATKVVLARDRLVYGDAAFDPPALVRRLRSRFPTCHTFHVDGLVGASPEMLIRRRGDHIDSVVLAGTAPRGDDPRTDARLGDELLASTKDLREHRPAVASVREALTPVTASLTVEPTPSLLRLANVQHLATRVDGTLAAPVSVLSLAGRLHPTAAVGGTPRAAALRLIAELETIDRQRYAGPVGWVDAAGDGEFAIALRCAQLDGARARLFAGAGIVAGSLPEAELEETRLKLRAMQSAFDAH